MLVAFTTNRKWKGKTTYVERVVASPVPLMETPFASIYGSEEAWDLNE